MWLSERSDDDDLAAAYDLVERRLLAAVEFMNAEGLYHFDIHPNNVLTDGKELYLTDFGLASSDQFELTEPEREFLATNATHDQCLARAMLVNCLVAQLFRPTDAARRNQMIRELASRAPLAGVPAALSGIMSRHAPVAVVINDFYWRLFGETRAARYPVEAAERVLRDSGFVGARD
jgi:serine/threonine protein kinase